MCLSEICTRFDVILLTAEVEYSLFLELDESITLIWMLSLCVWQNNLLSFSRKLLVELVSFSILHLLFCKQLVSDLSSQSWLYFQTVHGSK